MADFMTITRKQYFEDMAEAERRGAVRGIIFVSEIVKRSAAEMAASTGTPLVEGVVLGIAESLDGCARQVDSGELKL